MQILIIEDEPRAVNQLQKMLLACNFTFQLLGILDSVEEAVSWLQKHPKPDLIFLDIQLADGLSFEIFQKVQVSSPIIFTTAFDQYAIQAFKVNSIDYLLKPIKQEDLAYSLEKFQQNRGYSTLKQEILSSLLKEFQTKSYRRGILVREGQSFVQIPVDQVNYFYSSESLSFAILGSKRYILDESLEQLEQSINPDEFYRINRSQIVQKKSILQIENYFNHRLKLHIENHRDQEFIVSRTKCPEFKEWLNA